MFFCFFLSVYKHYIIFIYLCVYKESCIDIVENCTSHQIFNYEFLKKLKFLHVWIHLLSFHHFWSSKMREQNHTTPWYLDRNEKEKTSIDVAFKGRGSSNSLGSLLKIKVNYIFDTCLFCIKRCIIYKGKK